MHDERTHERQREIGRTPHAAMRSLCSLVACAFVLAMPSVGSCASVASEGGLVAGLEGVQGALEVGGYPPVSYDNRGSLTGGQPPTGRNRRRASPPDFSPILEKHWCLSRVDRTLNEQRAASDALYRERVDYGAEIMAACRGGRRPRWS